MTHGHGNNRAIYELDVSMAKLDYQRILHQVGIVGGSWQSMCHLIYIYIPLPFTYRFCVGKCGCWLVCLFASLRLHSFAHVWSTHGFYSFLSAVSKL